MSRTFLLADDSLTIRKVVEATFQETGDEVVSVGNGDEAVEKLTTMAPDLVIADIHMPGASGYEVARRVAEGGGGTPVLLLVGTFEPFDEADVEASGAGGVLMKPFDPQDLLQRVEELCGTPAESPGASATEAIRPEEEVPQAEPVGEPPSAAGEVGGPMVAPAGIAVEPEGGSGGLSEAEVERIARRIVDLMTPEVIRAVTREVVPRVVAAIRESEQEVRER